MKILHTADLHLGQTLYQHYERADEHRHFFNQLGQWCSEQRPDALLVSGDVFDVQNPSPEALKAFTEQFVAMHRACPSMHIFITAGNHDSASRLQAYRDLWEIAQVHVVGVSPSPEYLTRVDGWQAEYVFRLDSGVVVALPYLRCGGERYQQLLQAILDYAAKVNTDNLPVIMMAHTAVAGMDFEGHNFDIGTIRTVPLSAMGSGYDYLALGHIHKPQTLGHSNHSFEAPVTYAAPVARYSGSALHVSCDETYPHSVSMVEIDSHGGSVRLTPLRINQLRHFYVLPLDGSTYSSEKQALEGLKAFIRDHNHAYFRFRLQAELTLAPDFDQKVYALIEADGDDSSGDLRYNPKPLRVGVANTSTANDSAPVIAISDLQQMASPVDFILQTIDQYPDFDPDEVREIFAELEEILNRQNP